MVVIKEHKRTVLGIDPGETSGGICLMYPNGHVSLHNMPDMSTLVEKLRNVKAIYQDAVVYLEKINTFVPKVENPVVKICNSIKALNHENNRSLHELAYKYSLASAEITDTSKVNGIMKVYGHYNRLLGVLEALGYEIHLVPGKTWQNGIPDLHGKNGQDRKRKLKEYASHLNLGVKVTLKTADALLIADYGRRLL